MTKPLLLLVDDEISQLDSLERSLRKDFALLRANSAQEALAKIAAHPEIAMLICDMRLHDQHDGQHGLDVMAECKKLSPSAVRMAISGDMSVDSMIAAINSQVVDKFIAKPWEEKRLLLQVFEGMQLFQIRKERARLAHLATTDSLTELANRRYFDEYLAIEVDRANRHSRPLSLIILDLDHFKELNDREGHLQGDAALVQVGKLLRRCTRAIDFPARIGGDEFAVILPDTDLKRADWVAHRLLESSRNLANLRITLSLGVSAVPEVTKSALDLFASADRAMYQAKGQGRNQSIVATSLKLID